MTKSVTCLTFLTALVITLVSCDRSNQDTASGANIKGFDSPQEAFEVYSKAMDEMDAPRLFHSLTEETVNFATGDAVLIELHRLGREGSAEEIETQEKVRAALIRHGVDIDNFEESLPPVVDTFGSRIEAGSRIKDKTGLISELIELRFRDEMDSPRQSRNKQLVDLKINGDTATGKAVWTVDEPEYGEDINFRRVNGKWLVHAVPEHEVMPPDIDKYDDLGGDDDEDMTQQTDPGSQIEDDHADDADDRTSRLKFAFVTGYQGPHSIDSAKGAMVAAEEFGIEIEFFSIDDENFSNAVDDQNELMQELSNRNWDGIVFEPVQPDVQLELLRRAASKTNLVTIHTKVDPSISKGYIATSNEAIGREIAKLLKKALPNGGRVLVYTGGHDTEWTRNGRERGFIDELGDGESNLEEIGPMTINDYEIVDFRFSDFSSVDTYQDILDAKFKYDRVDAIVGLYPYHAPALLRAKQDLDEDMHLIGTGNYPNVLSAVADGYFYGLIVEDFHKIGYESVKTLRYLTSESGTDSPTEDYNATHPVINPMVATKENANEVIRVLEQVAAIADPFEATSHKPEVAGNHSGDNAISNDAEPGNSKNPLPPTSELIPWSLGNDMAGIAALYANGALTEKDEPRYVRVKVLAGHLGLSFPDLPELKNDRVKDSAAALHFLLKGFGEEVGERIARKYDRRHAELFELAMKSGSLLIIYGPGDELGISIADVISDRIDRTGLPPEFARQLIANIRDGKPADAIFDEVLNFHDRVGIYLEENGTPLEKFDSRFGTADEALSRLAEKPYAFQAYSLGFNWGMLADARLFDSELISKEFLPRAEADAKELGVDLGLMVDVPDRQKRLETIFKEKSIIHDQIQRDFGSEKAALFLFAANLQITRGLYDPDEGEASELFVNQAIFEMKQLLTAVELPETIVEPIVEKLKSNASSDDLVTTVFAVNRNILDKLNPNAPNE